MARPRRNDIAAKEFHKALTKLIRKRQVQATTKDIELWAYAERGVKIGQESIRKAHLGEVDPSQCALELLLALRDFYNAGPGELGEIAENRMSVIARFHSPSDPREQGTGASGWLGQTADGSTCADPSPPRRHLSLVAE